MERKKARVGDTISVKNLKELFTAKRIQIQSTQKH